MISCCCILPAVACTVIDATGKTITLQQPARRIVSLAPDITESLFAIHAGQQVIGVMSGSDYPEAASSLPSIGSYSGIDLERILALHPDLIVVWSHTFARQLSVLSNFGIPIYTTQPQRLEDIPHTLRNLGCLTGNERQANQLAEQFLQQLARLGEQYQRQKPLRVFYQIGAYSLITINKDSWINQVIELCGGQNVFAKAKLSAPEVGWEAVVVADPQVIMSDVQSATWKDRWQRHSGITAVKKQLLFSIPPDLIDRAGPRLLQGATLVCHDLARARTRLQH